MNISMSVGISWATLALLILQGLATLTPVSGEGIVAFDQDSYIAGDAAVFHVNDSTLATAETCTGTWTDVIPPVLKEAWWSLATGEPQPEVYQGLSEGCPYNRETPANTPIRPPPEPPWEALVGDATNFIADFNPARGEIRLLNNMNATSTVVVPFYFDIADNYPAAEKRARVTSVADPDGEWVAISEVTSETNASPHPTSALFRGQVLLGVDETASAPGDGAVRVGHEGDTLTVTYFNAEGDAVASDTVGVEATAPIPAASTLALYLMAGLFALLIAWRMRRRHGSRPL